MGFKTTRRRQVQKQVKYYVLFIRGISIVNNNNNNTVTVLRIVNNIFFSRNGRIIKYFTEIIKHNNISCMISKKNSKTLPLGPSDPMPPAVILVATPRHVVPSSTTHGT